MVATIRVTPSLIRIPGLVANAHSRLPSLPSIPSKLISVTVIITQPITTPITTISMVMVPVMETITRTSMIQTSLSRCMEYLWDGVKG